MTDTPRQRTVLFDHDGGVDDLLSLMMLLAMPHIDLAGVVVTPADCFLRPAVSASLKILRFFNRPDVPLSEGALHGVNPFPRAWRAHAYAVDAFPILNEIKPTEKDIRSVDNDTEPGQKGPSGLPDARGVFNPIKPYRAGPRSGFDNLWQRIHAKIVADLEGQLAVTPGEASEETVQSLYERILSDENIVLSRVERSRLFDLILTRVRGQFRAGLPAPVPEPGHEFIAQKLREAEQPMTVLITGPVSNLAGALEAEPGLAANIEEVVWMGGALQVPGNVRDYEHDGSAEWNAYWDPPATHRLWQFDVPLTLFSLDATNDVQVTMDFLHHLAQQRQYPLSDLAGQCWALTVGTLPAYEYTYYMWDTLTTGYLGGPQYMTFREARTEVVPEGPSAGRIKEVKHGGKLVQVAETVDVPGFLNYLMALLRQ